MKAFKGLCRAAALGVLGLGGLAGCTTQVPLVSHAHVGHAMTTWHDTPGQQGLLMVAGDDLAIAEREAGLACNSVASGLSDGHMRNALHALLPEVQSTGSGSGYGALRAFIGAVEHLEYAATSDDASLNLVTSVAELSTHGEAIHARLLTASQLALASLAAHPTDQAKYCQQLERELGFALHGTGVKIAAESGFQSIGYGEFLARLEETLKRETNPSYVPVHQRYVLGLVRLPTGEWEYRLSRNTQNDHTYSLGY